MNARNLLLRARYIAPVVVVFILVRCGGGSGTDVAPTPRPTPVVTAVTVTLASALVRVGQSTTASASAIDQNGAPIATGSVSWSSSNTSVATVTQAGVVTGVSAGIAQIIAIAEGRTGAAAITVTAAVTTPPPPCTPTSAIQMAAGDVRTLSRTEIAALCVGGLSSASEYVLIPFNSSNVAATVTTIELGSTNTVGPTTSPSVSPVGKGLGEAELAFRDRELRDIGSLGGKARKQITGVPVNPTVGSTVQLNSNLSGNTCADSKILHQARVVSVGVKSIVFADVNAPPGGYTDTELASFGAAFDTLVFALDTLYFGAPTDVDQNGRLAIFFTPGINSIPQPTGGVIGGLFAGRDLFPATASGGCIGSNEGEMFYMPVPDINKTINGNYNDKAVISRLVIGTLAHEFQHLINGGRRIYVNNAPAFEQVWLNEGLSHIAEELLYYRVSGNGPRQNIDLTKVRSSQAQLDAINTYGLQNIGRYGTYVAAPNSNSPYALADGLEMRGAIWDLLRYAVDLRAVGNERSIWYPLVNTTANGQANFNAVLGDIATLGRDWSVATFADDAGFTQPSKYQKPSWNYRSLFTGLSAGKLPLATLSLVAGTNVTTTIVGGGAAYIRFRVNAGLAATIAATSQGQAVPSNVDFVLMRTQ